MADIKVIKLKVRRGPNSQRKQVILDQGELGYTTDTRRLFVGTGTVSGGKAVGSVVFDPITSSNNLTAVNAELGDIVYAQSKLYQLSATNATSLSSWAFIGTNTNTSYLDYTNGILSIVDKAIDSTKLNNSLSSNSITLSGDKFVVNYNTEHFAISGNKFSLSNANAITISTKGLTGGAGSPLSAKPDNKTIGFSSSGELEVISYPVSAFGFQNLSGGFVIDQTITPNKISTRLADIDATSFRLSGGGIVTMIDMLTGASVQEMPQLSVSSKGIITAIASSIFGLASCDIADSPYNGSPDQISTGYTTTYSISTVQAIIAGTPTTLSSAGFILFEGGSETRTGGVPGKFAIPVFTYI